MIVKGVGLRLALFISLFWLIVSQMAFAKIIADVTFEGHEGRVDILITGDKPTTHAPKIFSISGDSPRIVIDWNEAQIAPLTLTQKQFQQGDLIIVKDIRHAVRGTSGLRMVLDIGAGVSLEDYKYEGSDLQIRLSYPISDEAKRGTVSSSQSARKNTDEIGDDTAFPSPRLKPNKKHKTNDKPVIIIDPGHGGRDPGAIGVKKTHEKSLTLKAALELKKQLLATGRYNVFLTRETDVYVEHADRIRMARIKQADLFISIHADSIETTQVRGASVYTLSDRAKKRSKNIVNSQNWIMNVDLASQNDSVEDILVDLAQRKTLSQSTMFADILIENLSKTTPLVGNTHRRAGYFVLLAPDVPAVLLELGFLSNPEDEKALKSARHRRKLMRSVTRAINTYFERQKS